MALETDEALGSIQADARKVKQVVVKNWVLGGTAAGNMTVSAPASATTGATGTISLSFSGLSPATKYLGSVAYGGSTNLPNPTIVRVDTP